MPALTGPLVFRQARGGFPAPPARGQIHVWLLPLAPLPGRTAWPEPPEALLSPDESARAARLILPELRERFTAARAGLRRLLGGYLGIHPAAVRFAYSPAGKPSLPPPAGLAFNLSHSGGLALAAFTSSGRLGVDLEQHRPNLDRNVLASRFFAPAEAAALEALPEAQRTRAFYDVWTRKEAFLKAAGAGLACPLDAFEVSVGPGEGAALLRVDIPGERLRDWHLAEIPLPPAYADFSAALALDGDFEALIGFLFS